MDVIDYKILNCLKENSRENATTIGLKVNLSTSAVIERIKKLEDSKIIKQYTTIVDCEKLGKNVMAFIFVRLEHPKYNKMFEKKVLENEQIVECHYIAGDFDYLLKTIADARKGLEELLNYIKRIEGVSRTRTSVVLSSIKNEVCLIPSAED